MKNRRYIPAEQPQASGHEQVSATHALFATAFRHHQEGRLRDAERMYRQLLACNPHHADSLHLLGLIAYQHGRLDDAIELIRKAIAANGSQAAYHANLGTIFHAQEKFEEAVACYQRAIHLQPGLATAYYNLGNVHRVRERFQEAITCYERALSLDATLAEAHYNLGNVYYAQMRFDEAAASYERALEIDPRKYDARHNLGNALQALGKIEEATRCYEEVLQAAPGYAKAHFSMGGLLHATGDVDAACECYRAALDRQPYFPEASFAFSLAQLQRGEFAAGWAAYEWRWRTKEHTPTMREYSQPLWNGEDLTGPVLIWGEQGIGDEIMFAGLIPDALRTGNRCVLDCDPRLRTLFARSFPDVEVVSTRSTGSTDIGTTNRPPFDFAAHLPSGSLPRLFRDCATAFTATKSPYLKPDPILRERFRSAYGDGRRLIGLSWFTNNPKTGRVRSIDLSQLAPLFGQPARWISLQYGDFDMLEKQAAAAGARLLIDRSIDQLSDIDAFAAQIAALDLVITIDNSTAHLAGALGIPTYVLLPFAADWRWMEKRDDTPWYPTVRLFRQERRDDWQPVLQRALDLL